MTRHHRIDPDDALSIDYMVGATHATIPSIADQLAHAQRELAHAEAHLAEWPWMQTAITCAHEQIAMLETLMQGKA